MWVVALFLCLECKIGFMTQEEFLSFLGKVVATQLWCKICSTVKSAHWCNTKKPHLHQCGHRVDSAHVLDNGLHQISHRHANSPGGVALQLDDLISSEWSTTTEKCLNQEKVITSRPVITNHPSGVLSSIPASISGVYHKNEAPSWFWNC